MDKWMDAECIDRQTYRKMMLLSHNLTTREGHAASLVKFCPVEMGEDSLMDRLQMARRMVK